MVTGPRKPTYTLERALHMIEAVRGSALRACQADTVISTPRDVCHTADQRPISLSSLSKWMCTLTFKVIHIYGKMI